MTANDLQDLKIIDSIIPEPLGGAHNDYDLMAARVKDQIVTSLKRLEQVPAKELIAARHRKYEKMGIWLES